MELTSSSWPGTVSDGATTPPAKSMLLMRARTRALAVRAKTGTQSRECLRVKLDDPLRLCLTWTIRVAFSSVLTYYGDPPGAVATKISLIGAVRRSILRRRSLHPNPT